MHWCPGSQVLQLGSIVGLQAEIWERPIPDVRVCGTRTLPLPYSHEYNACALLRASVSNKEIAYAVWLQISAMLPLLLKLALHVPQ